MRTLSLFESGDSTGEVSLRSLLHQEEIAAESKQSLEDVAALLVGGGWPESARASLAIRRRQVAGYCRAIAETEISTVDGVNRDATKVEQVLRSYVRHISSQASIKTITDNVSAHFDSINRRTVSEYLEALSRIFVIEDLPAWNPALRSKAVLAKSPVRYFVDPSLVAIFFVLNRRSCCTICRRMRNSSSHWSSAISGSTPKAWRPAFSTIGITAAGRPTPSCMDVTAAGVRSRLSWARAPWTRVLRACSGWRRPSTRTRCGRLLSWLW